MKQRDGRTANQLVSQTAASLATKQATRHSEGALATEESQLAISNPARVAGRWSLVVTKHTLTTDNQLPTTVMIPTLSKTIHRWLVRPAWAQPAGWTNTGANPGPAVFPDLEYVMSKGLEAIFALGGLVAFAYIIIGGFKYLTAGGDEKAIMGAKQTLTWAIIGLLVVVASFLILKTLADPDFLNLPEMLEFTIPR